MTNEARIARCEHISNVAGTVGLIGLVLLVAHLVNHLAGFGWWQGLGPLGVLLLIAFIVAGAADQLADRYRDANEGVAE